MHEDGRLADEWAQSLEGHLRGLHRQQGHDFYLPTAFRAEAASEPRGISRGRFQRSSGGTRPLLEQIVTTKPELSHLPVMANVEFGHTTPIITFPIGGAAQVLPSPTIRD